MGWSGKCAAGRIGICLKSGHEPALYLSIIEAFRVGCEVTKDRRCAAYDLWCKAEELIQRRWPTDQRSIGFTQGECGIDSIEDKVAVDAKSLIGWFQAKLCTSILASASKTLISM